MARSTAERLDTLPAITEVFREHGYEGASLSLIGRATGLGKGSLYHFFPGGKEEMAAAVLAGIDAWFETEIFAPLEQAQAADQAIEAMFAAVTAYFRSGRRACLVGVVALGDARDRFGGPIRAYFARWIAALTTALVRFGLDQRDAASRAEQVVAGVQGAIVLARALDDPAAFDRVLLKLRAGLTASPNP